MTVLVEKHRQGDRVPLLDVRADLPVAFVQVVEHAMARDRAARFPSPGVLEGVLVAAMSTMVHSDTGGKRKKTLTACGAERVRRTKH